MAEPYREFLLASVVILFSSLTFLLIQYDRMRDIGRDLEAWMHAMLAGGLAAPDQYRIGLALLAHSFEVHFHLRVNQSLPLIEAVSYAFALALIYLLFRNSPRLQNATLSHRLVVLGLFFAAAQFPVLWIFPWERGETLPTAFCLAAIVVVAVRGRPFVIACLLTALLALTQSLLRADVPVAIGLAFLLSAIIGIPVRPRAQMAALGTLCAAIGGGVQLYLQHVAFPQAVYPPNVPRIQLLANLNLIYPPNHIPVFLTALLPFLLSLALLRRYYTRLEPSDKLVLLICLVYLPIWITLGLVGEVRIFVPFLLLASPTIAKIWASFLLAEEPAHA